MTPNNSRGPMSTILNITNGDSTVEIMKQANIAGDFLPWRDVLHEGPVPDKLSLEQLSKVRAEFIVGRGWGKPETVAEGFIQRDQLLKSYDKYEKVLLWFEHDLYDQLQLTQILDWLHSNPSSGTTLSMVCTDRYLGLQTVQEMERMIQYEEVVSESQLTLASKAWSAFRSHSPLQWFKLLDADLSALPFLKGAVLRLLEEYPNSSNGLSRTEEQALSIISSGENLPGAVFARNQQLEERVFMGDASFWCILNELIQSDPPLLDLSAGCEVNSSGLAEQRLTINQTGKDVLAGKLNWLDVSNTNKWIGGVHLNSNNVWSWNAKSRSIEKTI